MMNPGLAFDGKTCREGHFVNGRCRVQPRLGIHDGYDDELQVAGAAPIRSYYSTLDYYTAIDDLPSKSNL